jgi:NAD dependent epimerase/dehydratase family enzyme
MKTMTATPPPSSAQHIFLTGGTGFIGKALVKQLLASGHRVTLWVRNAAKAERQFQGRVRCITAMDQLASDERVDAVVNLAGAPVVGPPWTARRKAQLLASRVGVTQGLLT